MLKPTALPVVHDVGGHFTKDGQHGVAVAIEADKVVFKVLRDGKWYQRIGFDPDQAVQCAGYFKDGADRLMRQGGSGLGDARRFDPVVAGHVILPGATLGQMKDIGHIFFDVDWKNAVSTFIRGNMMVFRIIMNLQKVYEIEFGIEQCGAMANLMERAAKRIASAGGSLPR